MIEISDFLIQENDGFFGGEYAAFVEIGNIISFRYLQTLKPEHFNSPISKANMPIF